MNKNANICMVTNIPAPYREMIHEMVSTNIGDRYKVIYCREREPNRNWKIQYGKYERHFLKGKVFSYKGKYIHFNLDIFSVLNKLNPLVVITTGYTPTFLIAFLWTKLNGRKHICFTDGWLESEKNLSIIHKVIRKIIIKNSDAFIGASKHSLKLFEYYGADKKRIFQSHLCIDNSKFHSYTSEKREFDLLFSGQFINLKMPEFFCEVAELINKKREKCRVLILGTGPLEDKFKKTLSNMGIEAAFMGFIEQKELPVFYAKAKIFLFPTRMECWGIVANEACAAGTPVITCKNAGVADDLIIDGYNGFVLPLNSEMWAEGVIKLLDNGGLWEQFSKNAQNKVREYNFENAANGIIRAIECVNNNKR